MVKRGRTSSARTILFLFLCPVPALAAPGIGPSDRRIPVPIDQAPWTALLRVQTELGVRCTGFLVAPRVAITAAHCLYLPKVGHYIRPDSVHVLLGYRAGRYVAHARVAAFTVASGYRPRQEASSLGLDRAVLVLDRPVAPASMALPVAAPPPAPAMLRLAGYGQDRDELAVADPSCRLTTSAVDAGGHALLAHDCQATFGTSGAPLLWQRPDGVWLAIGVQVAAGAGAGGLGAPLDR